MAVKPYKDTDRLKKARDRFKLASDADADQAQREKEDLQFYAGDQWPTDVKLARQGQQPVNGLPAVPARPTLVINKVREPVRQVQNEIRESDIGIELTPADDFGDLGVTPDDTEITLREGLIRRIIRDSKGQDAWNWAGDRADIAGRGYFAVLTRYLPGKTTDQEIYLDRLYNQASVVGDPSRTEPDGSDAEYWFWGVWMLADRFKAEFPKTADGDDNPFCDANDQDFMRASESFPTWYRKDGVDGAWSVRVVNYFYTEYQSRELVGLSNGETYWTDELPETLPEGVTVLEESKRTVVEKQIKFCKIGGGVVELERTDWPTPDMPVIETLGEELHPYDEQRRVEGMVRNARDAQMGFNYMVSKWVEQVGLTPIPPIDVDPEAIDGYEAWWAVMNTRALPYAPRRSYDDQGRPLPPPGRLNVDTNLLPMAQSVSMFDQAIKSTTAVPDPTLGNVDPSLKSGKAIREAVMNAKGSTSNFLTNRIRSIRRAAEVINGLLYPIYGQRQGRLVRVMTGTGESESMVIGDPQQIALAQKAAKVAKLTEDAKFNIAVKVTKNFDTRRQQENSALGDLISAEPQLMTWFGDLYLSSGDTPNRKQLSDRAKAMLAPPIQQMLQAQEQGQQFDPAAQAKIAQLQQQLQHAEAALQELDQVANGKVLENQTKVQIEQMRAQLDMQKANLEAQRDLEIARMDNATKQYIADVDAKTKGQIQAAEHAHDEMATQTQLAHEAEQKQLDRSAQVNMAAHDAAMADQQADRSEAESARGREHEDAQQDKMLIQQELARKEKTEGE